MLDLENYSKHIIIGLQSNSLQIQILKRVTWIQDTRQKENYLKEKFE